MARGFESKDVEFQQEEATRRASTAAPGSRASPAERAEEARRRTIQLALTKARADLAAATNPAHRQMLGAAIRELERQLQPGF